MGGLCVSKCVCVCVCVFARGCDMQIKKVNVWWGVHTSVHLCIQSVNSN